MAIKIVDFKIGAKKKKSSAAWGLTPTLQKNLRFFIFFNKKIS
jgi:hypothetical protein